MSVPPSPSARLLSERDYRLLADFRGELREFLCFSENAAREVGLHPQQHQALLLICGSPGGSSFALGELAHRLKIRHHSAVELVNRMEAKGLVRKAADPADRRRVLLKLTPRSRKLLRELSTSHKAELARLAPALKEILTHFEIFP